jgi:hypothetical protein
MFRTMRKMLVFAAFSRGGELFLPVKHVDFGVFLDFSMGDMPFSRLSRGFSY